MKFYNIDVNSNKLEHNDIFGRNLKVVFLKIAISEIENIATLREARFPRRCECVYCRLKHFKCSLYSWKGVINLGGTQGLALE